MKNFLLKIADFIYKKYGLIRTLKLNDILTIEKFEHHPFIIKQATIEEEFGLGYNVNIVGMNPCEKLL